MNGWLISIRPLFSEAIFNGSKTVELRRRRLHASVGDVLFVYETAPIMSIRGVVRVKRVETRSVSKLWREIGLKAAIGRSDYLRYFADEERASAIYLTSPVEFVAPLSLSTIRQKSPLFHPPRTWTKFDSLPLPLQVELQGRLIADETSTASMPVPRSWSATRA